MTADTDHGTGRFGALSQEAFLEKIWHRQPLFVKSAFADLAASEPFDEHDLAGLALEDDAQSRLVREQDGDRTWTVTNGPFEASVFDELPEGGWSLLVQGLEQWMPAMADLLDEFRFLPAWRLDDVMASFAPPGASVGPHYDEYDVFLIQLKGTRRWQFGPPPADGAKNDRGTSGSEASHHQAYVDWLLPSTDLRILADYPFTDTIEAGPGDMLYLPPGFAHHGVALDNAITLSIGFRSLDPAALAQHWSEAAGDALGEAILPDPVLSAGSTFEDHSPARIGEDSLVAATAILSQSLHRGSAMREALCRLASETRTTAAQAQQMDDNDLDEAEFTATLTTYDPHMSLRCRADSRLVYSCCAEASEDQASDQFFLGADGESFHCHQDIQSALRSLCDSRSLALDSERLSDISVAGAALLYALYRQGSVLLWTEC